MFIVTTSWSKTSGSEYASCCCTHVSTPLLRAKVMTIDWHTKAVAEEMPSRLGIHVVKGHISIVKDAQIFHTLPVDTHTP